MKPKKCQTEKCKKKMENQAVAETEKTDNACSCSREKSPEPPAAAAGDDCFYDKLSKLNESSGLSLVFNFREAILNLHLFYKEVVKRGGFYQVTELGNWNEVASALNLKSFGSIISPDQLQKVYATLLLQFERTYSNMLKETNTGPGEVLSTMKNSDNKMDQNSSLTTSSTSSDYKDLKKAPLKPRTGYQIFLRLECHKLKMVHGETSTTQNIRDMALHKWRRLSNKEKQPYVEASHLDKERYGREMAAFYWRKNENTGSNSMTTCLETPRMASFSSNPSGTDDDVYHVSMEAIGSENTLLPDQSMIEHAVDGIENDPLVQIDWDSAGYLEFPNADERKK